MNSHTRRRAFVKASSVALTGALTGCIGGEGNGDDGDSGPVNLRTSDHLPADNFLRTEQIIAFADRVNEEYGDEIQFEHFPGGQLGGQGEQLDLLQSGTADIAFLAPNINPDRLSLSTVDSLPGLQASLVEVSQAYWRTARDELQSMEYDELGTKPLVGANIPNNTIVTVDEPLEHPSDLEGMTIRGAGGLPDTTMEHLGASVAQIPAAEIYDALEQGTVDGALIQSITLRAFGLEEVVNYFPTNLAFGAAAIPYHITVEAFGSLTDEQQEFFVDTGDEMVTTIAENFQAAAEQEIEAFQDAGIETYEVPDLESEWLPRMEEAHDIWVGNDSDRQEVYDAFIEELTDVIGEEPI